MMKAGTLTRISQRLQTIATLTKGDKLCVSEKEWTTISKRSWYGSWRRYWTGEGRDLCVEKLKKLIEKTQRAIRRMSVEELFPFDALLKSAVVGLGNLKLSYRKDAAMSSNLDYMTADLLKLSRLVSLRVEILSSTPAEPPGVEFLAPQPPPEPRNIYYSVIMSEDDSPDPYPTS